ncbi:hypothetical protein EV279_0372 [Microbacterium sp. BK668]|nr:hypothetical protein EV279_0372 [Microbacterium sp. BK668]
MQCGVDIEGHEADEGEVTAEGDDEGDEESRDVRPRMHGRLQPVQDHAEFLPHAGGEDDEQPACRHGADVEGRSGQVAMRAQLAEVQRPPLGVGRRRDGDRRSQHKEHDRGDCELPRIGAGTSEEVRADEVGRGPYRAPGNGLDGRRHRVTTHKSSRPACRQAPRSGGLSRRYGRYALLWARARQPQYRITPLVSTVSERVAESLRGDPNPPVEDEASLTRTPAVRRRRGTG